MLSNARPPITLALTLALPLTLSCTLGVLACHRTGETRAFDSDGTVAAAASSSAPGASESGDPDAAARDRSVAVARGIRHVPHEVELDPRGEAALTLDKAGGLRLWPAIRSGDPEQSEPYALPFFEPLWMSLAQAEDGGFVLAVIDTTNAGHVALLRPGKAGDKAGDNARDKAEARLTPLFSLPPSDPLLELHVLDGGQRILALGVDHRVRLYDRAGELVSVIDERSFAPWQLRVVHAEPGQPPKLAAMLAQPLRVQALSLREDRLAIAGEARAVVLDRGPNRNDLALSPDGKTVAALRRRKARGRDFSIELIDLETGARRLVAGRSDSTIRPRMHFAEAERLLLETGSGRGSWIELSKAEALSDPTDAEPGSKLAKRLYATRHPSIPVPASAEHRPPGFDREWDEDWDKGERLHASVVAGLRVNVERRDTERGKSDQADKLIVDPLASDRHLALHYPTSSPLAPTALDHSGSRLARVADDRVLVEAVEPGEPPTQLEHDMSRILTLAFVDQQRLLLADDEGALRLYDWPTAALVAEIELDYTWAIEGIAYHPRPSPASAGGAGGAGVLSYRSGKPRVPVRSVEITADGFAAATELASAQRPDWLDILDPGDAELGRLFGMSSDEADERIDEFAGGGRRLLFTEKRTRTRLFVREGDEQRALELPAGQGRLLSISPDGARVAVVQFRPRDDGRGSEDHLLSVLDLETGERLWTMGSMHGLRPSWSGDSRRIAIGLELRNAETGELLRRFSPRLRVDERSDADEAPQN